MVFATAGAGGALSAKVSMHSKPRNSLTLEVRILVNTISEYLHCSQLDVEPTCTLKHVYL